jgi:hypothetical protein
LPSNTPNFPGLFDILKGLHTFVPRRWIDPVSSKFGKLAHWLAACDARTIKTEQLVSSELVYPERVGKTYSVTFDPEHRWFYVAEMRTDEVLVLKCYASKTDGRSRFAPHSDTIAPRLSRRPEARPSTRHAHVRAPHALAPERLGAIGGPDVRREATALNKPNGRIAYRFHA